LSKKVVIFLNGTRGIEVIKYLKKKNFIIDLAIVEKKEMIKTLKKKFFLKNIYLIKKNIKKNYSILNNFKKNIFISAGFSQIFTNKIINIPNFFFNLHAGKLPKYRGGSPLNWQIINNEKYYGISVIQLEENIDTGTIYAEKKIKLRLNDDIEIVHKKVNQEFPKLLYQVLKNINNKKLKFKKQNNLKSIYWHQRSDLDGYIDFKNKKTLEVHNFVRALGYPYKGAWGLTDNFKKVRIFKVELQTYSIKGTPGHIFFLKNKGLHVICKDQAIKILSYELENKKEDIKKRIFI
jgi:methionyl-tRNA formyltransferase